VEPSSVCLLVAAALLVGVALGIGWGKRLLAYSLTLGADLPGRTPHTLCGKRYWIVPVREANGAQLLRVEDEGWHGAGGW
jgi:hypothetical protein